MSRKSSQKPINPYELPSYTEMYPWMFGHPLLCDYPLARRPNLWMFVPHNMTSSEKRSSPEFDKAVEEFDKRNFPDVTTSK